MSSLDIDHNVSPPDGQKSFSGIPEANFVEDVDKEMQGEENAEAKLKVGIGFRFQKLQMHSVKLIDRESISYSVQISMPSFGLDASESVLVVLRTLLFIFPGT